MGFDTSTKPAQVAQAKNGEQLPSCRPPGPLTDAWSALQSSTRQHGITVPAVVIISNIRASHFCILVKVNGEDKKTYGEEKETG